MAWIAAFAKGALDALLSALFRWKADYEGKAEQAILGAQNERLAAQAEALRKVRLAHEIRARIERDPDLLARVRDAAARRG